MRCSFLPSLAIGSFVAFGAFAAFGCSQPSPMTSPEIQAGALSASVSADSQPILPGFDLDAAEIIGSGKFETATFALG